MKNLKSQTVLDATGTMVVRSTVVNTSLDRAILSHYAPYKLKFKISNIKSVYFVAALSPSKNNGFLRVGSAPKTVKFNRKIG